MLDLAQQHRQEGIVSVTQEVVCKVTLSESVRIPPRSQMLISGTLEGTYLADGMLEPYEGFIDRNELFVARTLVKPDLHGHIPLLVANPTNEEKVLQSKMHVGKFQPLRVSNVVSIGTQELQPQKQAVKSIIDPISKIDWSKSVTTAEQRDKLVSLLKQYSDVFARDENDLGCTNLLEHKIVLTGPAPPPIPARRLPEVVKPEVYRQIGVMSENGWIVPSCSPVSAPIVVVPKKGAQFGTPAGTRICVDFRALNAVTKPDSFPMPRIDEALDALGGSKWFSSLDLQSCFWQIPLSKESQELTAFSTLGQQWQFKVMPFGLRNASATAQRLLQMVLSGLHWSQALVYIDDILIFSKTFDEHLVHISNVLSRLRKAQLKLKPSKCHFGMNEVPFLGHIVSSEGVRPDATKIEAIVKYPVPKSQKELHTFIGMITFLHDYVPQFATVAAPLYDLLKKDATFEWDSRHEDAFMQLKDAFVNAPILSYPDFSKRFVLQTDASNVGIGAVLYQEVNDAKRIIAYASRKLTAAEKNYSALEKEGLAIVCFVKHFRPYLYGVKFLLRTDHQPLKWIMQQKEPTGRLARWVYSLSEYTFEVEHVPGKLNGMADALSRNPVCPVCTVQLHYSCQNVTLPEEFTASSIKEAQRKDPQWNALILYLEEGRKALPKNVKEARSLQTMSEYYTLSEEGLLLHLPKGKSHRHEETVQIVVPSQFKRTVFDACHSDSMSGHLGFAKTFVRIRKRYFWPKMHRDVYNMCKSCIACARNKSYGTPGKAPLKPMVVENPFEVVGIDTMGPLPVSKVGNKHIVIVSDYLTKYIEAFAVPDITADTIAHLLVDQVICRWGAPKKIISDRGTNFTSELVRSICNALQVKKSFSVAYHPQTDGQVERTNRVFRDMLRMYVDQQKQDDWDSFVPYVRFAYNTAMHESTGESPFFLMHGFDARLTIDVSMQEKAFKFETSADYREYVVARLEKARSLAYQSIALKQEKCKVRNDPLNDSGFRLGDQVMYKRMYTPSGSSPKFLSDWLGPYRIVEVISPQNVIIRPVAGVKEDDKRVHVTQLKYYQPEKPNVKPKHKVLKVGDVVWAKARYQPYWPAKIIDKNTVQLKKPLSNSQVLVEFFGKPDYFIVSREDVHDFETNISQCMSKAKGLQQAVKLATTYINAQ
jgi:hypothetical protein